MQIRVGNRIAFALAAALCLSAAPARAGDVFVAAGIDLATMPGGVTGTLTGFGNLGPLDNDNSAQVTLAMGFEFPLDNAITWEPDLPRWVPFEVRAPKWDFRSELQFIGGADWDVRADLVGFSDDFFSQASIWLLTANAWFGVPTESSSVIRRSPSHT